MTGHPPVQPFLASDVMAFVLALVAVLYAVLWSRDNERGMGWLALSMALLSGWAAMNRLHLPTGPYVNPSPWYIVMCLAMGTLALGLVGYLGVEGRRRRLALWATLLPAVAYMGVIVAVLATGVQVPRGPANLLIGLCFAAMGVIAWRAARHEPGAGHAWVAAALWSVPICSVGLVAAKVDAVALRYWGVLPVIAVALTLLTVTLLRRRRALEAEVTRRRAAETALTKLNVSLEQLVAQRTADLQNMVAGLESFNRSVSHDLRGSLGGMAGIARLADEALLRGDDALARRALPLIAHQAEDSGRLVVALLSLAKVGDATLRPEVVDLRRLVGQVVDQVTAELAGQSMPRIAVDEMPQVMADPELLKPVFANLIGNAIKFTRDIGAGHVDIGAVADAGSVTVRVRDNGVGFDASKAARLFSPFTRLHGASFDGHGIGLSIVRRAVERHGGRVWAESQPGQGASFYFSLPA